MSKQQSPWLTDPKQAHAQWRAQLSVADRSYAENSQRLYLSLFGRFCDWLTTNSTTKGKLDLLSVQATDIGRFLDSLTGRGGSAASPRTQRTYLAEIERVLSHLHELGLRKDNPALEITETARILAPLRPRNIHLPPSGMSKRFYAWIDGMVNEEKISTPQMQGICLALLMLECGLTPKELQKLQLVHLATAGKQVTLTSPGHRTITARNLVLSQRSSEWLKKWLSRRESLRVVAKEHYAVLKMHLQSNGSQWDTKAEALAKKTAPRPLLFVGFAGRTSSEEDQETGLRALGLALDRMLDSTIYEAAGNAMFALMQTSKEARQLERHKGPQALRNLCCANLIESGSTDSEIAAILGLRRNDQVWAMKRQLRMGSSETE